MGYQPKLTVIVEHEGATFTFSKAAIDREQAKLAAAQSELQRGDALPVADRLVVKEAVALAFMDLFAKACIGWTGYETEDGEAIPFSPDAVSEFPGAGEVGAALIEELTRLGESASEQPKPPTDCSPPEPTPA